MRARHGKCQLCGKEAYLRPFLRYYGKPKNLLICERCMELLSVP